jgi:quercetin dioxygenase-like cupin family protein
LAKAGQTIEVPQNGERFTFLETAADTDGELLRVEFVVDPGGAVPALHVHPHQEERFAVRGGLLGWHLDGAEGTARPGELVVIPPGGVHRVWNAGEDPAKTIVEFRPALTLEGWLEAYAALAAQGRLNEDGVPRLLDIAVMGRRYPGVIYAARPPVALQRLATPVLALIAGLAGRGR